MPDAERGLGVTSHQISTVCEKLVTPDEMKSTVDDLYELCATDMDKALALYIHDEFRIEESLDLCVAGAYRGKAGLKTLYTQVFAMVDAVGLEREYFMTGEDCCACRVLIRLADLSMDPIELMEFFRFQDGKIIEIRPYYFTPSQFNRAATKNIGS